MEARMIIEARSVGLIRTGTSIMYFREVQTG